MVVHGLHTGRVSLRRLARANQSICCVNVDKSGPTAIVTQSTVDQNELARPPVYTVKSAESQCSVTIRCMTCSACHHAAVGFDLCERGNCCPPTRAAAYVLVVCSVARTADVPSSKGRAYHKLTSVHTSWAMKQSRYRFLAGRSGMRECNIILQIKND